MKTVVYSIRFILAILFIYVAFDKILHPAIPADETGINAEFELFYKLLVDSKFMYFVCACELVCGLLLLFKRTYLLGAIMFVPLLLCLVMTHICISKSSFYIAFDSSLFILNAILIIYRFKDIKQSVFKPQKGWV